MRKRTSNKTLLIGGAAAVVLLGGGGLFLLTRGPDAAPAAAEGEAGHAEEEGAHAEGEAGHEGEAEAPEGFVALSAAQAQAVGALPEAAAVAPFFRPPPVGQPSRGATRRSSDRPKLAIARAHMPMFSASCGSTRITTGAGAWTAGRVRSVPEPVMISAVGSAEAAAV